MLTKQKHRFHIFINQWQFKMISKILLYLKQLFCEHKFQADTQITKIRCSICKKEHIYEAGVDLYPTFLDKP
jgi:hypothetical protein